MYSGMKSQYNYIELMAGEAGADTSDQSLENVRNMFNAAAKARIIPGDHNQRIDQLKWRTMAGREEVAG